MGHRGTQKIQRPIKEELRWNVICKNCSLSGRKVQYSIDIKRLGPDLKPPASMSRRSCVECTTHGLTNYIDTKEKYRHLKNWPVKGHCGRCLSVWGFESVKIKSVKLLQSMVSNMTQQTPPPPPSHTLSDLYLLYILWHRRGGESWTREKVRGATAHKAGSKIPTWLTVSPV